MQVLVSDLALSNTEKRHRRAALAAASTLDSQKMNGNLHIGGAMSNFWVTMTDSQKAGLHQRLPSF